MFSVSLLIFSLTVARAKPVYTLALAILLFLVNFFPFVWGVGISFFDFFPPEMKFAGIKNLKMAFFDPGFILSSKITALWAMTVMVIEIAVSYLLAISIYSMKKFSSLFYTLVLLPWAIPSYISVISWTSLIEGYGGDSLLSRIFGMPFDLTTNIPAAFLWSAFVAAWLGIPMVTLVILSSLQTISPNLRDLVKMEGANPLETALNVYIPQTFPVVFPYLFIIFLESFKEFSTIFLMTGGGPALVSGFGLKSIVGSTTTLGVLMYDKFSLTQNYGVLGAYSTAIGIVMVLLAFIGWNYRFSKKKRNLILSLVLVHLLFDLWGMGSGIFGIFPAFFYFVALVLYLKRRKFKKYIMAGGLIDLGYLILSVSQNGFGGISISSIISLILSATLVFEGRIYVSRLNPSKAFWKILKIGWMGLWTVIIFLPVWNVFAMGFSRENLLPISSFLPDGFTFDNFVSLFQNYDFGQAIINSIIISVMAILIAILTIFPATYAAVHNKSALRLGIVILVSSLFTGMHTLIPLAITFRFLDLLNSYFGVALILSVHAAAISYFLLYPFLIELPKNIEESAMIDGANGFTRMLKIIFPLSLPVLWTIIIFVFIDSWSSFVIPLIFLNNQNLYPVSMTMYNLVGQYGLTYSKWNIFGAGSIVNIVIVVVVFLMARKYIISGIISRNGVDD
ncbi:ABC transporter permease [Athalassotoga saccharophila]|uniref:ABC transporter permease n=1 Tax=Athalassotoga saccharophila TaxID=1441386 RepID=UPI001E2D8992|nr:ABC transporter permease subunit [Athalassotoga saccharophila]